MTHFYQDVEDDEQEEVCLASMCVKTGAVIGVTCVSMDTLHQGVMIPHGVYGTVHMVSNTVH